MTPSYTLAAFRAALLEQFQPDYDSLRSGLVTAACAWGSTVEVNAQTGEWVNDQLLYRVLIEAVRHFCLFLDDWLLVLLVLPPLVLNGDAPDGRLVQAAVDFWAARQAGDDAGKRVAVRQLLNAARALAGVRT